MMQSTKDIAKHKKKVPNSAPFLEIVLNDYFEYSIAARRK